MYKRSSIIRMIAAVVICGIFFSIFTVMPTRASDETEDDDYDFYSRTVLYSVMKKGLKSKPMGDICELANAIETKQKYWTKTTLPYIKKAIKKIFKYMYTSTGENFNIAKAEGYDEDIETLYSDIRSKLSKLLRKKISKDDKENVRNLREVMDDLSFMLPTCEELAEMDDTESVPTDEPETTKVPEVSKAPETTKAPEVTKAPEATKAPEITKAPEVTKTPKVTKAPTKNTDVSRPESKPIETGTYSIEAQADTELVLTAYNTLGEGGVLALKNIDGTQAQEFFVRYGYDGYYTIESMAIGGALSISDNNEQTVLQLVPTEDVDSQKFYITMDETGLMYLQPKCGDLYLEAEASVDAKVKQVSKQKQSAKQGFKFIEPLSQTEIDDTFNPDTGECKITCTVSSSYGIKGVEFSTWTERDEKDDIKWHTGALNGNKLTCTFNVSEHNNESDTYWADIYIYDKNGNKHSFTSHVTYIDTAPDTSLNNFTFSPKNDTDFIEFDTVYTLKNYSGEWFMNLNYSLDEDDAAVSTMPFNGESRQQWGFKNTSNGIQIATVCSERKLSLFDNGTGEVFDGEPVVIHTPIDGMSYFNLQFVENSEQVMVRIESVKKPGFYIGLNKRNPMGTDQIQVNSNETSNAVLWIVCDKEGNPINNKVFNNDSNSSSGNSTDGDESVESCSNLISAMDDLISKLDGKFFTYSGRICEKDLGSGHGCSNCAVAGIVDAGWFIDMFGEINYKNFPSQTIDGNVRNYSGRSCFGFACFAQYYIYSKVYGAQNFIGSQVANGSFSKEFVKSNVKPGDGLRIVKGENQHSVIVYSINENSITVIDSNARVGKESNCIVRKHDRSYDSSFTVYVDRPEGY